MGKKFSDDRELRELAMEILQKWAAKREVVLQVQALMNSVDDTLDRAVVLEELQALKRSGKSFTKVFAEASETSSATGK